MTRSGVFKLVCIAALSLPALLGLAPLPATAQTPDIPTWLRAHVGEANGQIAAPVLQRARDFYLHKVQTGEVRNPCYFAMDATRPNDPDDGGRFYIVCEAARSFRAITAGHGSGRDLGPAADFANGRRCAKNFSNALDSELTAGGPYLTGESKTSFKGYYTLANGTADALFRTFIQFVGEGETDNAKQRAIGGHAAVLLRGVCLRKDPADPHADRDGYVPFGKLVDYTGGRSDGCTSWSPSDADQILSMVKDRPTTLYIYPAARDIDAVARTAKSGKATSTGAYWNASCLKDIGLPKFWPRSDLEPIIARFKQSHPAPPARPAPICKF